MTGDPRWGRGQEVPSEDPTINSHYVIHYVKGLQEDPMYPGRLKVTSTGKHFMDYDCENCRALGDSCEPSTGDSCPNDRTNFNANVSSQDQVEYLLRATRMSSKSFKGNWPLVGL